MVRGAARGRGGAPVEPPGADRAPNEETDDDGEDEQVPVREHERVHTRSGVGEVRAGLHRGRAAGRALERPQRRAAALGCERPPVRVRHRPLVRVAVVMVVAMSVMIVVHLDKVVFLFGVRGD